MDFLEQFFHISPDGGDGTTEFLWIAAVVFALLLILFRRRIMKLLSLNNPVQ